MSRTFAEVVESVKKLSRAEKEELQELLRKYSIEEERDENGVRGRGEGTKHEIPISEDFDGSREDFAE